MGRISRSAARRRLYWWRCPQLERRLPDRQSAPPQRRHHRPRRPRQDHARRRDAPAGRRVPGQRAGRRAGHGLQRPGARARHHHPGQEHRRPLRRDPDQHRRHARATPTSAARSSACCRWSTACCCSSTPPRARCRRPASCCARPSSAACRRSSSSTRSTAPTRAPQEVLNEVYDLFIDLDATDEQIDFPVLYTSGRAGTAEHDAGRARRGPAAALRRHRRARAAAARAIADAPLQMLVANLDYSDYLGRIAIGRIFNGRVKVGDPIVVLKRDGPAQQTRVTKLFAFDGLKRIEIERGRRRRHRLPRRHRGHRHRRDHRRSRAPQPDPADRASTSRRCRWSSASTPRRSPAATASSSPRGTCATASSKELLGNVSLRVEDTDTPEQVKVLGRGELQLAILIEMMRREGYELQVSRPEIVTKEIDGVQHGAGRGAGHRRRRGVPGRGHRQPSAAPRRDDQDGQPRRRPRAPRVPRSRRAA